jgi:hypothetical protein
VNSCIYQNSFGYKCQKSNLDKLKESSPKGVQACLDPGECQHFLSFHLSDGLLVVPSLHCCASEKEGEEEGESGAFTSNVLTTDTMTKF